MVEFYEGKITLLELFSSSKKNLNAELQYLVLFFSS